VSVVADVLVALGGATSGSVLPSLFSFEAPPGGVGTLLGIGQSVHSAAGVLGPIASGYLYENFGPSAPGTAAAGLCLLATAVFVMLVSDRDGAVLRKGRKSKDD
jgi:MFS family permease